MTTERSEFLRVASKLASWLLHIAITLLALLLPVADMFISSFAIYFSGIMYPGPVRFPQFLDNIIDPGSLILLNFAVQFLLFFLYLMFRYLIRKQNRSHRGVIVIFLVGCLLSVFMAYAVWVLFLFITAGYLTAIGLAILASRTDKNRIAE